METIIQSIVMGVSMGISFAVTIFSLDRLHDLYLNKTDRKKDPSRYIL